MGSINLRPVTMAGLNNKDAANALYEAAGEYAERRRRRHMHLLIMAIIVISLLFLLLTFSRAQDCPTFAIGDTVSVYPGDFLDGRAGVVFQPGWWADGTPIYVVQVLNRDGSVYGYIGATGCDLHDAP